MNILTTLENYAKTIGVDIETLVDADYHAFLAAATPLYQDLKAYAETTGKADLQTLLNDLKTDLVTAVTALATSGGNVSAAIAAVATQSLSQIEGAVTGDAKNALYGALAIVATDVPEIVGAVSVPASTGTAPATTAQSS
jgi:hypothetical protein